MDKIKIAYYCADVDPLKTKSLGIYKTSLKILEQFLIEPSFEVLLIISEENKNLFKKYHCKKKILKTFSKNRVINRLWLDQIGVNKALNNKEVDFIFFPKGIIPLYKRSKIKYVSIVYDLIPLYYLKKLKLQFFLGVIFLINSIIRSDILFSVSRYSKDQIAKYTKRSIKIIPLGIPINGEEISILKEISISKPYFFVSGNRNPHKNLDFSLKLVSEYNSRFNKKYSVFYPQGNNCDEEIAYAYKNAELCISLSSIEGLGYATLESYSFGTPGVFNNSTGIRDVSRYINDKKGACDIQDKESVFKAINLVLKMTNKEIDSNRRRLLNRYNWENCGRLIISEIKQKFQRFKK